MTMKAEPFKWRHYSGEIILLCVRWYLRYNLSYRDLAEMMRERGLEMDHSTIWRWVQAYSGELKRRLSGYWKPTNDSWRVDETSIKIKKEWFYLYRAIDSRGQTLDFHLSRTRDAQAAYTFFCQVLQTVHVTTPRVINVDKAAAYPIAFEELQTTGKLPPLTHLRQVKYLNNLIEQDHRFVKRRVRGMLGFKTVKAASQTLTGIEVMHMFRKGQLRVLDSKNLHQQVHLIHTAFGITV